MFFELNQAEFGIGPRLAQLPTPSIVQRMLFATTYSLIILSDITF
jgi:hypothetical protein